MNLRTRRRDTLDPAVQQHVERLSPNWRDVFLVIFILNMDRRHNLVELFILGPPMARMALSWMAQQGMARSLTTLTTPESRTDQHKETSAETSERGLNCCQVVLRISQIFLAVPGPDSRNCHERDGVCTDNTSPHARTSALLSVRTLNVITRVVQDILRTSKKSFCHRSRLS